MAINVDKVYKTVLSILNKEQRGYITPDEFNKIATQSQLSLLDTMFSVYNKDIVGQDNNITGEGYADLPSKTRDRIDVFYAENSLSSFNDGIGTLPTDIYKIIEVSIPNTETDRTLFNGSIEEVNKNKLTYLNQSPLTKPTSSFPVYYKTSTQMVISPKTTANPTISYVKVPTNPRWGYTIDSTYGTNIYDSATYVEGGLVIGTPAISIVSTNQTGITNGTQSLTVGTDGVTTSGNGTGAQFTITITGTTITSVKITSTGAGFAVGDTITIPTTFTWMSGSPVVLTIEGSNLYNTSTRGSTNFELHPSDEANLVLDILSYTGITIKDPAVTQLSSQLLQSQEIIKR